MLSEKGELILTCQGRDIYRLSFDLEGIPCSCFLYLFRNTSHSRALKRPYAYQILRISQKIRSLGFPSFKVLAALRPKNELLNWNSLLIAQEILDVKELQATGFESEHRVICEPFSRDIRGAKPNNLDLMLAQRMARKLAELITENGNREMPAVLSGREYSISFDDIRTDNSVESDLASLANRLVPEFLIKK